MSYFTGSVNSYEELRDTIKGACLGLGWSDQGNNIISRNGIFVSLIYNANGVIAYVGTGVSAGALVGAPSLSGARLGKISPGSRFAAVVWPATYHIFVHKNPDEVYVILNFSVNRHYWFCFGKSDIPGLPGSGNWFAGCAVPGYTMGAYGDTQHYYNTSEGGGGNSYAFASGPWWHGSLDLNYSAGAGHGIHVDLDAVAWTSQVVSGSAVGFVNAHVFLNGLPQGPNAWNGEAPLLPISLFMVRASSKVSLVLQKRHARYVRIDNYEPGQVITLGHERWKVFPFGIKNATSRNGTLADTGTFGWAIRYEEEG